MAIKGTVEKVFEKNLKGGKKAYSIKLDTTGDTWYGNGFRKPICVEGDYVSFEAVKNERGYWNVDGDIIKLEKPQAATSGSTPGAAAGSRDGYWAAKELRDVDNDLRYNYRFAVAHAAEVATTLLQAGLLPHTTKSGKKSAPVAYDDVMIFIEEYAAKVFRRTQDLEGLNILLQQQEVESEEADPAPGPSEGDE